MNFYPIYRNKKLLPWIKWWLIKGNKVMPKHLSEWIDSAEAITLTGVYKGSPLLFLNLNGNTSQTGTPTPEAPVPVNVVKEDNTIKINDSNYQVNLKGKNLFDSENATIKSNFVKDDSGNDISSTGSNYTTSYTEVLPSTNYTFSYNLSSTVIRIYYYDENKNWISRTGNIKNSSNYYTFTTPNNCHYIQFQNVAAFGTAQLEQGSEPTTYEPYYDYELCKIGDYQDVIYKENNKWYVDKYIGKVVLNGSEPWKEGTAAGVFLTNTAFPSDVALRTQPPFAYSTHFNYHYYSSSIQTSIKQGEFSWSGIKAIVLRDTSLTSLTDLTTWLGNNNVTVYYILETSTTTEITETTLISQLEAIYNAKLQSGTNEITQLPADLPFYLNFQYYEKG